jgi:hypothetical protein
LVRTEDGERFLRFFKENGARYHALCADIRETRDADQNISVRLPELAGFRPCVHSQSVLREKTSRLISLANAIPRRPATLLESGVLTDFNHRVLCLRMTG